jgi:hypothetical protein
MPLLIWLPCCCSIHGCVHSPLVTSGAVAASANFPVRPTVSVVCRPNCDPAPHSDLGSVFKSPSTLNWLECYWDYDGLYLLSITQPLAMVATLGTIFIPCYWCVIFLWLCGTRLPIAENGWFADSYKLAKKGEGSEWSAGNFYLYFQAFCIYLHVRMCMMS